MPDDLDLSKAATHLASGLPAGVVAYAVREAIVDRLMDHLQFERVGRTIEGQVRPFRRRRNLAAKALASLADAAGKTIGPETGMFPYIAVQAMPFGDRDHPGQVAVVLDVGQIRGERACECQRQQHLRKQKRTTLWSPSTPHACQDSRITANALDLAHRPRPLDRQRRVRVRNGATCAGETPSTRAASSTVSTSASSANASIAGRSCHCRARCCA